MNHPLLLLTPAGFAAFGSRARWTMLIGCLTLVLLAGLADLGPDRVDRAPAPGPVVTTVSGTTVPDHACGTASRECRP